MLFQYKTAFYFHLHLVKHFIFLCFLNVSCFLDVTVSVEFFLEYFQKYFYFLDKIQSCSLSKAYGEFQKCILYSNNNTLDSSYEY